MWIFTLSLGSWIHKISGVGLPTTSHDNVTVVPISDSTDFGRVRNTGPSGDWRKYSILLICTNLAKEQKNEWNKWWWLWWWYNEYETRNKKLTMKTHFLSTHNLYQLIHWHRLYRLRCVLHTLRHHRGIYAIYCGWSRMKKKWREDEISILKTQNEGIIRKHFVTIFCYFFSILFACSKS